ncbi:hypothetical protein BU25DRAFT_326467, partial [Macroventuria anomochaeta]
SLPKSLVEALSVTVRLGYEYVWIDSLCIIQDSQGDWIKEAATMGLVYRHSVCTIAAAGAKDGDAGCFFDRQPLRKGVYTMGQYHDKPLHSRAWVVQERCLSPHMLNLGTDQISWACIQSSA